MANKRRDTSTSFLDDEASLEYYDPEESSGSQKSTSAKSNFLGMTPPQRFIIVLILFLMTCVLGSFCLILSGKIYLPF